MTKKIHRECLGFRTSIKLIKNYSHKDINLDIAFILSKRQAGQMSLGFAAGRLDGHRIFKEWLRKRKTPKK